MTAAEKTFVQWFGTSYRTLMSTSDINMAKSLTKQGLMEPVVITKTAFGRTFQTSLANYRLTPSGLVVAAQLQAEYRQQLHAMWCRVQSPYHTSAFKNSELEFSREWDMQLAGLPELND